MNAISESDLIINPDGSIYHLQLRPEQLADTIITVGDPERVPHVSRHFDSIEYEVQHREFVTHTGSIGQKRITVLSTGMGTDNIDIALNELDALANIDFESRTVKQESKSLHIIRLGTSGSVNEEVGLDSLVVSEAAIGIDNLMAYYRQASRTEEMLLAEAFLYQVHLALPFVNPYAAFADADLLSRFETLGHKGVTVTAPGFFGPQGRQLRTVNQSGELIALMHKFSHANYRISNLEMETAGIYALGAHLGHRCISVSAVLADRIQGTFSADPQKAIDRMIVKALDILAE